MTFLKQRRDMSRLSFQTIILAQFYSILVLNLHPNPTDIIQMSFPSLKMLSDKKLETWEPENCDKGNNDE